MRFDNHLEVEPRQKQLEKYTAEDIGYFETLGKQQTLYAPHPAD